jgi:A/G-specific adenine glycosylase
MAALSPASRRRLLRWFERHQRDLPWRRDRDPYRIWVSEAMLQQTQVAAVIPYFERFLAAFPTLADLADADLHDVLRLWEGLGYYRRARDLHCAARHVVERHGGCFPDHPDAAMKLPGVGRYMAGAILSQAFDRRLPIVEANTKRVLCRLFGRDADPRSAATQQWLWETAEQILPRRNVGEFNQSLMELGQTICTAKAPRCDVCPLATDCVARRLGRQERIPRASPPPRIVEVREAAVVIRRRGQVLLVQRPPTGRWAGMWEFPHGPLEPGETHESAADRIARSLTGMRIGAVTELLTLRHGITRFRITMVCFEAAHQAGRFASSFYTGARWVRPTELASYPVSSPQRKLANQLIAGVLQRSLF